MSIADAEEAIARAEAFTNQWNDRINAVVTPLFESARQTLSRDRRRAEEGAGLPLLGVTVSVKDNIDTEGVRTTSGSRLRSAHVPERDATAIARLRAAGASVVAKVNLDEFALGSKTQSSCFGGTRNPWALDRVPGGSSGGSGAAVAAEMCRVSIGTDTGGSIRLPAALNGVSGIRPSWGRVPTEGVMPVSSRLDTVGPLAYAVADLARVFEIVDGWAPVAEPESADLSGLRLGLPTGFFLDDIGADVGVVVEETVRRLEGLGAVVVPVQLALAQHTRECIFTLGFADAAEVHRHTLATEPEKYVPAVRRRLETGARLTTAQVADGERLWSAWRRDLDEAFGRVDLILSPTVPGEAPPIAEEASLASSEALGRFTGAWALSPGPTLVLPCGAHSSGMPIGLQLSAARGRDWLLLWVGMALQTVTDWHLRRPSL